MIFKTLNGDLTVFNKTLISTKDHLKSLQAVNATVYNKNGAFNLQGLLVNSSQSVSTFTKLSNAFKVYNGNLSKSTQLQNAYVQAIGKQNVTLGNYLAGLNGAKASIGGYVKSLVAAKAASIGLQVASIALNTAISMGITLAISALVSQISKWVHAQEESRQKAIELTNSYKEQKASLDSQIEKYKELKKTLDNGNLSTDETRSIKEQLLEIQKSLIESYGDEASNIDLVNGKYREQLGLLNELSKEKATDYVTENRDVFKNAKKELEKIKTYDLGTVTSWSSYAPKTEDQQKLLDFIDTYSDLLELTPVGSSYGSTYVSAMTLSVKADVESADEIMHQFAEDLEEFGKDNNIDVSNLLEGISGQLKKTWTDELKEYKTIYDEFMKAEIVRNDALRPLYQQSIQAVEDYNNALSSGKGIDEAKANLDAVQQSVQNTTGELEGSQEVFGDIYDSINKNAEVAYQMSQAFKNDESVKGYAEQLRGLTDIDLQAINFEDNVLSPGEEAFKALIDIFELSEDEVQKLIDKLVEFGYVQGEVQDSTLNKNPISLFEQLTKSAESLDKFQSSLKTAADAYTTLLTGNYSSSELLDSIQAINKAASDMGESINWESISISDNPMQALKDAIETVSNTYAESVLSGAGIDPDSRFGQMLVNIVDETYRVQAAYDAFNSSIDTVQSAYDKLNAAVGEYNENGYVTLDTLQSVLAISDEYISCLMDENGKLVLNEELYEKLTLAKIDDAKNTVIQEGIQQLENIALSNSITASEKAGDAAVIHAKKIRNSIDGLRKHTKAVMDDSAAVAANNEVLSGGTLDDLDAAYQKALAVNKKAADDVMSAVNTKLAFIDSAASNTVSNFSKVSNAASSASKETKEASKDTAETFNWIDTLLSRIQRTIKNLGNTVSSTWKNWTKRNSALASELSAVRKEIDLQKEAYNTYMWKAESTGLSSHYRDLVKDGSISIEDISDETLKEQIRTYKEWWTLATLPSNGYAKFYLIDWNPLRALQTTTQA